MNQQMGLTEFFSMEASDYLEQLDALVSKAGSPQGEEFLRLARALRGSALMANQQAIGAVSEALEGLARAVSEGRLGWDHAVQHTAVRAVDDLKILVRNVSAWTDADSDKASAVTSQLRSVAGEPKEEPARTDRGIDTGTRAFIAREGAGVASALNQLARAIQREPPEPKQFDHVIRLMQPLRGLAVLSDLPPIPEILDGIERAISAELYQTHEPHDVAVLFDVGARALSSAAQEVASLGAVPSDSAEAQDFVRRLGALLDVGGDVVPIEVLYFDDDGPHVIKEGTPSATPGRLVELELIAHGEHLREAAAELERAQWETQRELRALTLAGTFRSLVTGGTDRLGRSVTGFALAASEAVNRGAPTRNTKAFVARLREAGTILSAAPATDHDELATKLDVVTQALRALPTTPKEPEAAPTVQSQPSDGAPSRPRAPSAATEVSPAEVETPAHLVFEPVSSDEAEATETVEPAVAELQPQVTPEDSEPDRAQAAESETDLAAGWIEYERLVTEFGDRRGSVQELLDRDPDTLPVPVQATPVFEEVAPIEEETYEIPDIEELEEREEITYGAELTDVVPITDLVYSGTAALERAVSIQIQIREAVKEPQPDGPLLTELVEELLDLVQLSIGKQETS